MTIQQLKYFVALAQCQHFGDAARACFVSQPSLSYSISELERELETTLIYRDNRNVQLSPAGKMFYRDALNIIQSIDDAVIRAKRVGSGILGSFRIGTLGGLASREILSKIRSFRALYPDIDVTFGQTNMKSLNMGLMQGTYDIALTRELDVVSLADEIGWVNYSSDTFGFLVPCGHPIAEQPDFDILSLADENFVVLDEQVTPNVYRYQIQLCASRGLIPRIAYKAQTLEILCNSVKAGMGLAIAPSCAKVYCGDELSFIPLGGEDAVSAIVFAWRRKNPNPIVSLFLEQFDLLPE